MKRGAKAFIMATAMTGVILTGCGKAPDEKSLTKYLEKRYDKDFDCVSVKDIQDGENGSGKMYEFKDEDGIKFNLNQSYFYSKLNGHDVITEDYMLQWILKKPELYQKLMDSPYECEIFGLAQGKYFSKTGFVLNIENFDELAPAITLAYKVVKDKKAMLTDLGYDEDEIDSRMSYPEIQLKTKDNKVLSCGSTISFQSKKNPMKTSLNELIRKYSYSYIDAVREGRIAEDISDTILKKYGPKQIYTVTYEGQNTNLALYRDNGNGNNIRKGGKQDYYIYQSCNDDSDRLQFDIIEKIAKYAGYSVMGTDNKDQFCLVKGTDEIVFSRESGETSLTKNGTEMVLQGSFTKINGTSQAVLTVDDIKALFGLKIELNLLESSAEIK